MNTEELYGYLDCFLPRGQCTYSVLPCNLLYEFKIYKYPLYLIVNTARSTHPTGIHWVTLYQLSSKSPLLFLDSYGYGISKYDVSFTDFAIKNSTTVIEGDRRLQNYNSTVCGHYAVYFIYRLYKTNGCLNLIYNSFSNDTLKNDLKVKNFVKKRVCKLSSVFPLTNQCCTSFEQ
jgi:hypothetical protein